MSVGAWEPNKPDTAITAETPINQQLLTSIIHAMETGTEELAPLDSEIISAHWLAGLPQAQWLKEAENWNSQQVWMLIRFFTLAEMQLPEWQSGAESPVIPLAKSLRRRKAPLGRDELLWIRQHSNNRYLPYGPL